MARSQLFHPKNGLLSVIYSADSPEESDIRAHFQYIYLCLAQEGHIFVRKSLICSAKLNSHCPTFSKRKSKESCVNSPSVSPKLSSKFSAVDLQPDCKNAEEKKKRRGRKGWGGLTPPASEELPAHLHHSWPAGRVVNWEKIQD